ncbi:MAG: type II toxin-antitoxin system RelE/ParE family toxin [Brasilonema angustatum HA4187-MV1]|nr:type II toxin-antitoxin system RelE/ParE family toxin [Brasilonema angustatum HA4187-MV1]
MILSDFFSENDEIYVKGDRKGEWSVTVSKNWRVTFTFQDGNAYDVNYEDYH